MADAKQCYTTKSDGVMAKMMGVIPQWSESPQNQLGRQNAAQRATVTKLKIINRNQISLIFVSGVVRLMFMFSATNAASWTGI
jgi:hypothetical protein